MKQNGIIYFDWYIDTSRNGNPAIRDSPTACQNWCNIKGRVGLPPTADAPEIKKMFKSAYFGGLLWVKPPGESDGCSYKGNLNSCNMKIDIMCIRDCDKPFQQCGMPRAGEWSNSIASVLTHYAPLPTSPYNIVASGKTTFVSYHKTWLSGSADYKSDLKNYNSASEQWTWEYLGNKNG